MAEIVSLTMKKIRVLVIEDNRLLRSGITMIIEKQPDLKVVAATGSSEDAVRNARKLKPHVILLDLGLQDQNSLRVLEMFKKELPRAKVVIMDLIPTQEDIIEFVEAGASGFILLKDTTCDNFLKTIRSVAQGAKVFPPPLNGLLFSQVIEQAFRVDNAHLIESVRMSKREREVIELIADGLGNKEIAQRLHVATHIVKSHVHNILEKVVLHSRLEIAACAHTKGTFKIKADKILEN